MTVTVSLSPAEVESLWTPDGLNLPLEQSKLLPEIAAWLERLQDDPVADLLRGRAVSEMPADSMKILATSMLERFRPMERGVAALQLLGKVMDRGNALGISLPCPPPVPFLIKRQTSPFAADRWSALEIAPQLRRHLATSLTNPAINHSPKNISGANKVLLGQFLLCAILHGGLIHISLLDALLRRILMKQQGMECLGERVYVELSLGWKNQKDAEFRRWFMDPLSAVLMMRLSKDALIGATGVNPEDLPESLGRVIWQSIRAFFRHSGLKATDYPASLPQLLSAVRLDLDTRLPPVLVNYATRSFVSHSLKTHVWQRIHGEMRDIVVSDAVESLGLTNPGHGILTDVDDRNEPEPRWMLPLRKAMQGEDRKKIQVQLENLIRKPEVGFGRGETGELFAAFALRMFSVANDNKVKLAVRTARAYVISASKRLGGLMGTTPVNEFGIEEWTGLYEEALNDVENAGMRRKLVRVLREFHRFLELTHDKEKLDARDVFSADDGLVPVDATIITPGEFERIRQHLSSDIENIHPKLSAAGWLVLTLAYRCGLRRMEVLQLEMNDLLLKGHAELLVRPTEARRLKTKNATRKIPLHVLLDETEINTLKTWHEQRIKEIHEPGYERFLFAIPELTFSFVPQDTLFPLLHKVMREVTGDPSLRFHHLRHSFASWCFLTLMQSDLKSTIGLLQMVAMQHEPDKENTDGIEALSRAKAFREKLYGKPWMTRKHVWAISGLLGHSGPDISMEHYIHLVDITLAEHLMADGIAPALATLIAAYGGSQAQAYRLAAHTATQKWVAHLWEQKFLHGQSKASRPKLGEYGNQSAIEKATPKKVDSLESITRIRRLLLIRETRNYSFDRLSQRYGIPSFLMQRYTDNALWLSNLKMSPNGTRYRHRFMDWIPDRRYPENKTRIACPITLRESRDRDILRNLIPDLRKARSTNGALTKSVLKYYAENSRPDFSGMIFTDPSKPEPAIEFLRWLELMGIPRNQLRFIGYNPEAPKRSPLGAWTQALQITKKDKIDRLQPPNGRNDWNCPWIAIEPLFETPSGEMKGSAALRYLMIMTIIVLPR